MQRASPRLAGTEGQRHTATGEQQHAAMEGQWHTATRGQRHAAMEGQWHVATKGQRHTAMEGQRYAAMKGQWHVDTKGQQHAATKGQRYMATEGQQHTATEGQQYAAMEGQRHVATKGQQHVAMRATWQLGALHPASAPPLLLINWQRSQSQAVHGRSLVDLHTCVCKLAAAELEASMGSNSARSRKVRLQRSPALVITINTPRERGSILDHLS